MLNHLRVAGHIRGTSKTTAGFDFKFAKLFVQVWLTRFPVNTALKAAPTPWLFFCWRSIYYRPNFYLWVLRDKKKFSKRKTVIISVN